MEFINSLSLTESTEINFYISDYKGVKYANIRKFVKSDGYTGPTHQGITLTENQLVEVVSVLELFNGKEDTVDEMDILTIGITEEKLIKVLIKFYKGHNYLDVRFFYKVNNSFLPSKKGISIPIELFSHFTACLKSVLCLFNKTEADYQIVKNEELSDNIKIINAPDTILGVPSKYAKYF